MANLTWRRRSVGSMLVLVAFSLVLVMSAGSAPSSVAGVQDTTRRGVPLRYECPLTDSIIVGPPFVTAPASTIPVAGPLSHIPEFHDCQRFIRRKYFLWSRYDSLYAIFASFRLDSLWLTRGLGGTSFNIRCDASTIVTRGHPCISRVVGDSVAVEGNGIAFAEIVSWGGTYDQLGIGPGYNCLYLFDPATPKAFMVKQGLTNDKCATLNTFPTGANVKQLPVRRTVVPTYAAGDYPPVARWDWDHRKTQQYIGIRCGAAWCEVSNGDAPLAPSVAYVALSAVTATQKRVVEIKGWYDEQRLDVGVPSGIRGNAFPAPGLHTFNLTHFTGNWVPVAFISLASPHPKYQQTFNFGSASIGPGVTFAALDTVELCHGPNCAVPQTPALNCTWGSSANDHQWWARIKRAAPGQPPMYKCVTRRGHEGLGDSIPGTVRWRWMGNDETVWMRCDVGCCEVHP